MKLARGQIGCGVVDLSFQTPGSEHPDQLMEALELFGKKLDGKSRTLRAGNLGRNGSLFGRPKAPNSIKKIGPSIDSTRSLMALKFPIPPKVPTRSNKFNHLGGRGFFAVSAGFRARIAPMTAAVLGPLKTRKR